MKLRLQSVSALFFINLYLMIQLSEQQNLQEAGCKRWQRQSLSARCDKYFYLYRAYCPEYYKADCENRDGPIEDLPKAKKGGGSKNKNKKTKSDSEDSSYEEPVVETSTIKQVSKSEADNIYKACCAANGVPEECMGLCTYFTPNLLLLCNREFHCENYFKVMAYCGPNGKDNSACCERKTLQDHCDPFCHSLTRFPKLLRMFDAVNYERSTKCLQSFDGINECNSRYHDGEYNWEIQEWPQDEKFGGAMEDWVRQQCSM